MITVTINKSNNGIKRVTLTGHARFNTGNDIVCAGVSAVIQTTINGIATLASEDSIIIHTFFSGDVDVEVMEYNASQQLLLESMLLGLVGISDAYPNNVEVIVREE
jgi:uncharacterized protein YsxB (DUF464 family)